MGNGFLQGLLCDYWFVYPISYVDYFVNSNPKNYPLAPDKYSRHAQYYKMLLFLRSLNEHASGDKDQFSDIFLDRVIAAKSLKSADLNI